MPFGRCMLPARLPPRVGWHVLEPAGRSGWSGRSDHVLILIARQSQKPEIGKRENCREPGPAGPAAPRLCPSGCGSTHLCLAGSADRRRKRGAARPRTSGLRARASTSSRVACTAPCRRDPRSKNVLQRPHRQILPLTCAIRRTHPSWCYNARADWCPTGPRSGRSEHFLILSAIEARGPRGR